MRSDPSITSAILALAGFAVAVVAGLSADIPATTVLARALLAMFACYVVGMGVGSVLSRVAREHVAQYRASNPIPSVGGMAGASGPEPVVVVDEAPESIGVENAKKS
ncbi:MAG: hypothetical protein SFY69_00815 [Planctomycetota bacterium]|nr:hypothetical protein [Planctomycetota bacterium]